MKAPEYFQCQCHTPYHAVVMEWDEDVPAWVNVSVVSTKGGPFWHRVKYALRHIFAADPLIEADIILDEKRVAELVAYLTSPTPSDKEQTE